MRHRKVYIWLALSVAIAGLGALTVRGSRAQVVGVRLRSYGAVILNEKFQWEAVFEVTNLTSSTLRGRGRKDRAEVSVAQQWQDLSANRLFPDLQPNCSGRFRVYVPNGAQCCRFALEYEREPLRERVDFFLSNHKLPASLDRLCRRAAGRFPHSCSKSVTELELPTTTYRLGDRMFTARK